MVLIRKRILWVSVICEVIFLSISSEVSLTSITCGLYTFKLRRFGQVIKKIILIRKLILSVTCEVIVLSISSEVMFTFITCGLYTFKIRSFGHVINKNGFNKKTNPVCNLWGYFLVHFFWGYFVIHSLWLDISEPRICWQK